MKLPLAVSLAPVALLASLSMSACAVRYDSPPAQVEQPASGWGTLSLRSSDQDPNPNGPAVTRSGPARIQMSKSFGLGQSGTSVSCKVSRILRPMIEIRFTERGVTADPVRELIVRTGSTQFSSLETEVGDEGRVSYSEGNFRYFSLASTDVRLRRSCRVSA